MYKQKTEVNMETKNIGVIGSGDVGRVLANGFLKYGHRVMIGTRDASKLTQWKEQAGEKGQVGSFADAAAFGDIIVLAAKGTAAKAALELAGAANLAGKTIIDAANPIADAAPENGVLKFFTDLNNSLMEQLQAAFPGANFVKAFNSIGSPFMINPDFKGIKPTMFICGNNEEAKKEVAEIVELFGFDVEDMGSAAAARAIEPLCMLWCIPGLLKNEWAHAFKLLKL
jgi:predicted dinucleotide-binding enzyme